MSRRGRLISWLVVVGCSALILGFFLGPGRRVAGPTDTETAARNPELAAFAADDAAEPAEPKPAEPSAEAATAEEEASESPEPVSQANAEQAGSSPHAEMEATPVNRSAAAPVAPEPKPADTGPPPTETTYPRTPAESPPVSAEGDAPRPSPVPSTGEAPRIVFEELVFDFGMMYQQEEVSHEFAFTNQGNGPLRIGRVQSTCGCTAAIATQGEIAPGESGVISITFRSGRMRSRVTKHIYVESNDPLEPRATLTVTGEVKEEVEVVPRGIYIGTVLVGETLERSVVIRPVDVESLEIVSVTVNHAALRVADPVALEDGSGGYRLDLQFGPVDSADRISAKVIVRTNLEHSNEIYIAIYGRVQEAQESGVAAPAE